jgi:hypothetical protein
MSRLVCFIDKIGLPGTCSEEAKGKTTIDCKKCRFYKKFKGKESEEFLYCCWKGELNTKNSK